MKDITKMYHNNDRKIFNNNKNNEKPTQEKQPEQKQEQITQNKPPTIISTNDMSQALNVGNEFFESKLR